MHYGKVHCTSLYEIRPNDDRLVPVCDMAGYVSSYIDGIVHAHALNHRLVCLIYLDDC